jgi:hypothetical protein
MMVIPAFGEIVIISVEYAADGLAWARLYDNHALGWIVDETMPVPLKPAPPLSPAPYPLIVGNFPMPAPDTGAILSPQWCKFIGGTRIGGTGSGGAVIVPDLWRGQLPGFLTWLATNNGARRQLQPQFVVHAALIQGFRVWAARNPSLVLDEPSADA